MSDVLTQACERSGITLLSIAHRPALKRFHDVIIHFVSVLLLSVRLRMHTLHELACTISSLLSLMSVSDFRAPLPTYFCTQACVDAHASANAASGSVFCVCCVYV